MDSTGKLSVERNTSFFSDESLSKIQNAMQLHTYPANNLIFLEGDILNKLFVVKSGYIKLSKLSEDGKNLVFHYFFPLDLFGEFNAKEEEISPFTARTVEDSSIGVIDHGVIEKLFLENNDLMFEFMQWQNHMKRFTQLKLRDLLFHGKDGALASSILRIANTYGRQQEDNSIFVTQKFTNNDFAEMVGSSRETVNRLLLSFKKKGIIAYKNGWIEVLDLSQLKELCYCEECPVSICRL